MAKQQTLNGNGANLCFEAKMWTAADKLRNNMDAAEYKHVVLGLIFLKYISDAFPEVYQEIKADLKALDLKKETNIKCETCSGCQKKPVGQSFRKMLSSPLSA